VKSELPKIVKDAQRLRAAIEMAFTRMARRHKYSTGADIRGGAKTVVLAALRAWRDPEHRLARVEHLCDAIDSLKVDLQLGKDVDAFRSWAEFDAIVRLAVEVGQQSGGWRKRLLPKGQNEQGQHSPAQRAPILSSRAASAGATP
jgi:hypothetical protein